MELRAHRVACCNQTDGHFRVYARLGLRYIDAEQAFVQSDLNAEIYMRLPPGCGSFLGQVVRLNNRSMVRSKLAESGTKH